MKKVSFNYHLQHILRKRIACSCSATISRVSGTDGPATVKIIQVTDSTPVASTSTDYFSVDTTVSFADGESSKTFLVNLKNDDVAEFSEKFFVFIDAR